MMVFCSWVFLFLAAVDPSPKGLTCCGFNDKPLNFQEFKFKFKDPTQQQSSTGFLFMGGLRACASA